MLATKVYPNQSWTDLAVQCYGNVDAVIQLIDDNVKDGLAVDFASACSLPFILVREDDPYRNEHVLRSIPGAIIATMK